MVMLHVCMVCDSVVCERERAILRCAIAQNRFHIIITTFIAIPFDFMTFERKDEIYKNISSVCQVGATT